MSRNNAKNALVTGAARRLGREIAIALARDGWNIAVHHNSSNPEDVVAEIKKLGVKVVAIKADLLDFDQVQKLVPQAAEKLGEINLLVNSASLFEHIKFMETDENTYDSHMDIHVKAPFFLSQEFALHCKNGGRIINIIDSAVTHNCGGYFAYFLSKKALRGLNKMLAKQLAPNILVNAVLPSIVDEFSDNVDQVWLKKHINELPLKKLVKSKQVTDAVVQLAKSEQTGQEIFVDNGEQLL